MPRVPSYASNKNGTQTMSLTKKIAVAAALTVMSISGVNAAGEHEEPMRSYGAETVTQWISNADLIAAIKAQNAKTAALSEAEIVTMDKQWRAQTGAASKPMIDDVLGRPVSKWLSDMKEKSGGVVTEVFVMDAKGLNVAQSDVTSDYWQGDEAKWKQTFLVGPGAVHVSDVEEDESTQTLQSQLSMPVVDPASGQVIGAVTIGVNLDALL